MLNDHTHFKTKDGIIFTTRGFYHPIGYIRSVPLYKPSTARNSLEKRIDEFGDIWLQEQHPKYIRDSEFGRGVFVPVQNILETFDPFSSSILTKNLGNKVGAKIVKFLWDIEISEYNIGLLGSRLVNTGNKPHDVDLVIRGIDNLDLVKENFDDLLNAIGGKNEPMEQYVEDSVLRYERKYNKKFNSFKEMIDRRWPTIHIPGKFFGKLRFTYLESEVPVVESPLGEKISNVSLKGKVINAFGTNFMPRNFIFSSEREYIKTITYFWDFSYCVQEGDDIIIRGDYFPDNQIVLICNPKEHGIRIES